MRARRYYIIPYRRYSIDDTRRFYHSLLYVYVFLLESFSDIIALDAGTAIEFFSYVAFEIFEKKLIQTRQINSNLSRSQNFPYFLDANFDFQ